MKQQKHCTLASKVSCLSAFTRGWGWVRGRKNKTTLVTSWKSSYFPLEAYGLLPAQWDIHCLQVKRNVTSTICSHVIIHQLIKIKLMSKQFGLNATGRVKESNYMLKVAQAKCQVDGHEQTDVEALRER